MEKIQIQPQYNQWKDKGNNIGIQCLVCGKTHWTGNEDIINPLTQQPCTNCEEIKGMKIRETEQANHNNEPNGKVCEHRFSQPVQ